MKQKIRVLLVCLGNICRSPLAAAILQMHLKQRKLENYFFIDSAGTSDYHVGASSDARAVSVAADYGVSLQHLARQFKTEDFAAFDYILVMDHLNYDAVISHANVAEYYDKVFLVRTFDDQANGLYDVPDPYYGSDEDFAEVCDILKRSLAGFIDFLQQEGELHVE